MMVHVNIVTYQTLIGLDKILETIGNGIIVTSASSSNGPISYLWNNGGSTQYFT